MKQTDFCRGVPSHIRAAGLQNSLVFKKKENSHLLRNKVSQHKGQCIPLWEGCEVRVPLILRFVPIAIGTHRYLTRAYSVRVAFESPKLKVEVQILVSVRLWNSSLCGKSIGLKHQGYTFNSCLFHTKQVLLSVSVQHYCIPYYSNVSFWHIQLDLAALIIC